MIGLVILLALFGIKHFICDFWLQYPRMLAEKGIYGARGGIEHAVIHGLGTLIVLLCVFTLNAPSILVAVKLALLDSVLHYHIDWAKQKLNKGLTPADRKFWLWLGLDQLLHYLTYLFIIGLLVV